MSRFVAALLVVLSVLGLGLAAAQTATAERVPDRHVSAQDGYGWGAGRPPTV